MVMLVFPAAAANPIGVAGTTPSITKDLLAPREFVAARDAKVKVAALPAASLMVPLFNAKAVVLV